MAKEKCNHTNANECTCICHKVPNVEHIRNCCVICNSCGKRIDRRNKSAYDVAVSYLDTFENRIKNREKQYGKNYKKPKSI